MEKYTFKTGDLELLAMGALPIEEENALLLILESNEVLRAEYEEIQSVLFLTANQNSIRPVPHLKGAIASRIFNNDEVKPRFRISAVNIFRIAAALLLVGSLAFNLFLLDGASKSSDVVDNKEEFSLEALPFEEKVFKEMFAYLKDELSAQPCEMDFRTTKEFLSSHNLDTQETISFLQKHDGHCDCEVLMNVAQYFPNSQYRHGGILPKVHMASKSMTVSFLRQYKQK
ncbi:DUF2695 domain-containing protein [Arcticibacterium luteifluviistationis]|uniref:DUF2695 domain-containing protein n=1 Tax=Arcticibacterium luteifluviistationis TaxID=1784714 RepID=A0A2Z4GBX1_9BACT|nr:DUF2695 domain-containing protein [Arcticibacterium luteifluviistationis]AWV98641.1 hypothetical protein DJ013_10850 [Arcticibacterium luteifluviistationis]